MMDEVEDEAAVRRFWRRHWGNKIMSYLLDRAKSNLYRDNPHALAAQELHAEINRRREWTRTGAVHAHFAMEHGGLFDE